MKKETRIASVENQIEYLKGIHQAGIEFIYHMREHIVDVGAATIYLFACYALYLWLKKKIK